MKNTFAQDYEREQEIKRAFYSAENEEGREAARKAHNEFSAELEAKGKGYAKTYELYSDAKERGNDYIDISECWDYIDEKALIDTFRELGIEKFTFSSGWTKAAESAWKFVQNGCSIDGMLEINAKLKDCWSGEYEKTHGFLFSIN